MFASKIFRTGLNYQNKRRICNSDPSITFEEKIVFGYYVGALITGLLVGPTYSWLSFQNTKHLSTSAMGIMTVPIMNGIGTATMYATIWPIALPCFLYDCYNKTWHRPLIN